MLLICSGFRHIIGLELILKQSFNEYRFENYKEMFIRFMEIKIPILHNILITKDIDVVHVKVQCLFRLHFMATCYLYVNNVKNVSCCRNLGIYTALE